LLLKLQPLSSLGTALAAFLDAEEGSVFGSHANIPLSMKAYRIGSRHSIFRPAAQGEPNPPNVTNL
jgi:hypothetical protein